MPLFLAGRGYFISKGFYFCREICGELLCWWDCFLGRGFFLSCYYI